MNKLRNVVFTLSVSLMALFACNSQNQSFQQVKMEDDMDSLSYSIGVQLGKSYADDLQSRGLDSLINNDLITQGLNDYFNGEEKINPEEAYLQINQFFMAQNEKMKQEMSEKAGENLQAGEKFLEENSNKEGVVSLESGLQYKVITEGTGIKPKATDIVKVHYHGTLLNGKVFDSSVERGQPAEFQLNQVIKGWTEGLQYMSEGSKYIFYIPSELAYGDRGAGGLIGPNETLIFEVELLEVME